MSMFVLYTHISPALAVILPTLQEVKASCSFSSLVLSCVFSSIKRV